MIKESHHYTIRIGFKSIGINHVVDEFLLAIFYVMEMISCFPLGIEPAILCSAFNYSHDLNIEFFSPCVSPN